MVDLRDV